MSVHQCVIPEKWKGRFSTRESFRDGHEAGRADERAEWVVAIEAEREWAKDYFDGGSATKVLDRLLARVTAKGEG